MLATIHSSNTTMIFYFIKIIFFVCENSSDFNGRNTFRLKIFPIPLNEIISSFFLFVDKRCDFVTDNVVDS